MVGITFCCNEMPQWKFERWWQFFVLFKVSCHVFFRTRLLHLLDNICIFQTCTSAQNMLSPHVLFLLLHCSLNFQHIKGNFPASTLKRRGNVHQLCRSQLLRESNDALCEKRYISLDASEGITCEMLFKYSLDVTDLLWFDHLPTELV